MRELVNKTRKIYCGCFNIAVGYLFYYFFRTLDIETSNYILKLFLDVMVLLISLDFLASGIHELIHILSKNIQKIIKRMEKC